MSDAASEPEPASDAKEQAPEPAAEVSE